MSRWCVLFFCAAFASAEAQTLTGTVRDTDGAPLPFATLVVVGSTSGTTTAADGGYRFDLSSFAGTNVTVRCSFMGMRTAEKRLQATGNVVWDIVLEAAPLEIGPVVVSAGRFEQRAEEVTVSLDILPPRIVEQRGTTSLENALEQTPGVSFVDGEPQIRSGSGFSYGAGSRVMILVDDLPILSGDAGRPSWGFLPVENLEQVEVIKGAASVLYGSSALSGVINVRTRYPDARPLTRVTLQHGAYSPPRTRAARTWEATPQLANVRFLHSQQLGGWDVVVGGNLLGDDGHLAPVDSAAETGFNPFTIDRYAANSQARVNAAIRRRTSRTPGLQYGLGANWQWGESLNTLIWQHAPDSIYGSYEGAATRTRQLIGTLDPHVSYISPGNIRHSLRGRWQHLTNGNDNSQSNASDVVHTEYQIALDGQRWGIEGLHLVGGALHQFAHSNAELYSGGSSDGNNSARTLGAYLQTEKRFGPRLNTSFGLRYESFQVNDIRAGKPVFRAGLNWTAWEGGWLRASYGQGFRFPTIAERYIRTGLGSLQIYPNEELLPEFAESMEIGFKQGVKAGDFKGFADVAVFRQNFTSFIEFTFGQWGDPLVDPLAGLGFMSVNTGDSRVTGAEGSLAGQWDAESFDLDVLLGYTYTRPITLTPDYNYSPNANYSATYLTTSHDTTNYILKYRSPHLVRADAHLSFARWFVGMSLRYQSQLDNFDQAFLQFEEYGFVRWGVGDWLAAHPRQPWVADLRAGVNLGPELRLSLVINNLFNSEYSLRPLNMEPPRLTQLMLTYERS